MSVSIFPQRRAEGWCNTTTTSLSSSLDCKRSTKRNRKTHQHFLSNSPVCFLLTEKQALLLPTLPLRSSNGEIIKQKNSLIFPTGVFLSPLRDMPTQITPFLLQFDCVCVRPLLLSVWRGEFDTTHTVH